MKVLITGVAGFIGFHLAKNLLNKNYNIVGVDNINSYYDVSLKNARLKILLNLSMNFNKFDLSDTNKTRNFFESVKPDFVIHLAAQAGVRNSLKKPHDYLQSNITAFLNILEACRFNRVQHLFYASSSSVYGNNSDSPFHEVQNVDSPQNIYAVTKKSNELMAYSYSSMFKIPTTGLRFFTVYGPWGRPDMSYFKFVKNIMENKQIEIYGHGKMYRDFTYIDDIIDGVTKLFEKVISESNYKNKGKNNIKSKIPYEIFNIGNNKMESLETFVSIIEKYLGKKAKRKYTEMQLGDMQKTSANIFKIKSFVDYCPSISIDTGLPLFIDWYKQYYNRYR